MTMLMIKAAASNGESRTFGPFEGFRIREGRRLHVRAAGTWRPLAFSFTIHQPPVQRRTVVLACETPIKMERNYSVWRFLDERGKIIGFDAEHLDFIPCT